MNFTVYGDDENFLITNSSSEFPRMEKRKEFSRLYGYLFTDTDVVKNCSLEKAEAEYLAKNKSTISGIFCAVIVKGEEVRLFVDPMVQYNIFYCFHGGGLSISNSILLLREFCGVSEIDGDYLFDSIAYTSPLRGRTVLKGVYALQYDDLLYPDSHVSYKPRLGLGQGNLHIVPPDFRVYDGFGYYQLKRMFLEGLNRRAAILSEKYEEVQIQLTGGADSRLALSSFLNHRNKSCYVYGDGTSQNRLVFEQIVNSLRLRVSKNSPYVGKSLGSTALIIKGLVATNFRKLNNLNTYVNADRFVASSMCKVTGYYGANVCGGVSLPPGDLKKNGRTGKFRPELFSYHDYVDHMRRVHSGLSGPAFADIFYLNNRGPSHYAAHSVADNQRCNSYDILYDPINLFLVRSCPYTSEHINRNAITIDLIHENNSMLALFPYDSRKIPIYREFREVPLINCFDGFSFPERDLQPLVFVRHESDFRDFDILQEGGRHVTMDDILSNEVFHSFYSRYETLEEVKRADNLTKTVVAYFLLASLAVTNLAFSR